MVRELGFEMKAQPSEKMKTPEELAREEREKLQKLEVRSKGRVAAECFYLSANGYLLPSHKILALTCFNAVCGFLLPCVFSRLIV